METGKKVLGGVVGIMERLSEWIANLQVLSPAPAPTTTTALHFNIIKGDILSLFCRQLFVICFFSDFSAGRGGGFRISPEVRRARFLTGPDGNSGLRCSEFGPIPEHDCGSEETGESGSTFSHPQRCFQESAFQGFTSLTHRQPASPPPPSQKKASVLSSLYKYTC